MLIGGIYLYQSPSHDFRCDAFKRIQREGRWQGLLVSVARLIAGLAVLAFASHSNRGLVIVGSGFVVTRVVNG
jgi:hypothetical protein